jgi:glycerol-3-phosphate dehydrogenase subunit B
VSRQPEGHWHLAVDGDGAERTIRAAAVILASGRFLGRGLHADRDAIRETIFDLPVKQPGERAGWHDKRLFAPRGHPINRAGLAVDDRFRPVNARGETIHANLFAAGSILADQDWVRQKCGSGLAIATAYGAVQAVRAFLSKPSTEQSP